MTTAEFNNLKVENFHRSSLVESVTEGTKAITVSDNKFPTIAAGSDDYFYLSLVDGDTLEVVKVIANSGQQLTAEANIGSSFNANTARAESWLTAEAWAVIQLYISELTIDAGNPDLDTIYTSGGDLAVRPVDADGVTHGLGGNHIKDAAIVARHLADNSVTGVKIPSSATIDANRTITADHIKDDAVTDDKIVSMTASKLTALSSAQISTPVTRDAGNTTSAGLDFEQIAYTAQDPGDGTPSGGLEGQIWIEFEAAAS